MELKTEPRLLVSDKEAIERAARALRRGSAFVVLVCPRDLTEQTRACLSAEAGPLKETVAVNSGEAMLDVLLAVSAASESDPIFSVSVPDGSRDAFVALNIHREKVLRGGRLVLWLDSSERLESLRQVAPDAWAFRTAVIVVRGDVGLILPRRKKEEPEELIQWRKRYKRAKSPLDKARAGHGLAESLRWIGALAEAERVARACLALISHVDEEERITRVKLLASLASTLEEIGMLAEVRRIILQALEEADTLPLSKGTEWRVYLLACLPGPFGRDRDATTEAILLGNRLGVEPNSLVQALKSKATLLRRFGDIPGLRSALDEVDRLRRLVPPESSVIGRIGRLDCYLVSGHFGEIEQSLRQVADEVISTATDINHIDLISLELLMLRGEMLAAERALQRCEWTEMGARVLQRMRWAFLLEAGKVAEGLLLLRDTISEVERLGRDGDHLDMCGDLVALAESAHAAECVSTDDWASATALIDASQIASRRITGSDAPPWYEVEFLTLRARLRTLSSPSRSEATVLFRAALEHARAYYPDLVPTCVRSLAAHFIALKQPEEALSSLGDVESEASSKGMLRELSNLRAVQVQALVALGRPDSEIEERMQALRTAVDSMDAPRRTAEVILDLASELPPATTCPDVLVLSEEAQLLFFEMPMPAQEARAMEVAGDALLARGRPAEARSRYAAAKARLERFGLLLRVPLLERKLASIDKQAATS
ncbi:MAG: hypothetical protein U0441_19975 [Polyangiaceae bacterium]